MKVLKDVNPEDWKSYVLAYDNMWVIVIFNINYFCMINRCNIDRLKLLKKPLSIEEPFPEVWKKVSKIIGNIILFLDLFDKFFYFRQTSSCQPLKTWVQGAVQP